MLNSEPVWQRCLSAAPLMMLNSEREWLCCSTPYALMMLNSEREWRRCSPPNALMMLNSEPVWQRCLSAAPLTMLNSEPEWRRSSSPQERREADAPEGSVRSRDGRAGRAGDEEPGLCDGRQTAAPGGHSGEGCEWGGDSQSLDSWGPI